MRILLTGAAGFLGWHTRTRLTALTDHDVVPVTRSNWTNLTQLVADLAFSFVITRIVNHLEPPTEAQLREVVETIVEGVRARAARSAV